MTIRTAHLAITNVRSQIAKGKGSSGAALSVFADADIILGGPDVTLTTGFPLSAGLQFNVELEQNETLYAIAANSTTAYIITQGA